MKTYPLDQVKITEQPMVRDMTNKAILRTDLDALHAYKDRKKAMEVVMNSTAEIETMKDQINNIKTDISSIKEMLTAMVLNKESIK